MTSRFEHKGVIVTGGGSGIGRATAARLAEEGAQVVIADINIDSAQTAAKEIQSATGSQTFTVQFDAADPESCRALIGAGVERLGKLDVVCNIAGIMDWGHTCEFSDDRWVRVLQTNLTSVFVLSKAAIPHLLKTQGNIVNMASAAGLTGIAYAAAYCAAKAGVIAMTKSLAVEFATGGVRINAIAPGGVKTPMATSPLPDNIDNRWIDRMHPKLRNGEMCEPTDIAAAVAYLASEEARYVTGIVHSVDGGQTCG